MTLDYIYTIIKVLEPERGRSIYYEKASKSSNVFGEKQNAL